MRTLGVEEEFLLVTPEGRPEPVATAVLRHASTAEHPPADEPGGDVEKEFKQEQIEP
jgi:carboxylate-amine ligase